MARTVAQKVTAARVRKVLPSAPPLSFVRHYLESNKIKERVSNDKWKEIQNSWADASEFNVRHFRNKPFLGLRVNKKMTAEEKSQMLKGQSL
jgi:hypothetical protein